MPQIDLTPAERREHRADAHHLDPVVMIGGDGLTPAVQKEVDAALNAHGLIKVRVFGDDRAAREQVYLQLCDELNAAPSNILVSCWSCGVLFLKRKRPLTKTVKLAHVTSSC